YQNRWNQVATQESSAKLIPTLHEMQTMIRRLGKDINSQIASTSQLVSSPASESEIDKEILNDRKTRLKTMEKLRNCLQSAASIVTSASTSMGFANSAESSTDYRSEFGDVFPPIPSDLMLQWIESNKVDEISESDSWKQLSAGQVHNDTSTL